MNNLDPTLPPPSIRAFPTAETNLARILNDPNFRSTFHARLKQSNPFVVFFYRIGLLPLFGASRTVMLLTTRGRKTGRLRSTPIGYFLIGGVVHVFSAWGKSSNWYKNWSADPSEVQIQIGMRRRKARAEILSDPAEIQRTIEQFIRESPQMAKYVFGWDPQSDRIESSDFSAVIQHVLVIRFL